MRFLPILLFSVLQLTCSQNKSTQSNKTLNNHSMNQKGNCNVPAEIIEFIDSTTVFALAGISSDGIENMANDLFLLNKNKTFIRIENEAYPEDGQLFSSDLDKYETNVADENFNQFISFLESVNTVDLNTEYKTPEDLRVNGGMRYFVFIKTKIGEKWLCFEPESGDFIKEIKDHFNKIFD